MKRLVQWGMLLLISAVLCEAVFALYFFHRREKAPLVTAHYANHLYHRWRLQRASSGEPIGIWRDDARLGYAHRAGAVGTHRQGAFSVRYTIENHGERITPVPAQPRGRAVFIGCSYTFGWGVEDAEAFPYRLATQHWRDIQIHNRAVNGYGTVHSYLLLQDALAEEPPPSVIVYPMIPDHVCRNYLRPSWLEQLAASGRSHPHFEIVAGRPQLRGLAQGTGPALTERVLRRREAELTASLLADMHEQAQRAQVPFFVVLLPQKLASACSASEWPPTVLATLGRHDIPYVDLTELRRSMGWLEGDSHPNRNGHRLLAEAIAGSAIGQHLLAHVPRSGGSHAVMNEARDEEEVDLE